MPKHCPDPNTRYAVMDCGYTTECWIWNGPKRDGYGIVSTRKSNGQKTTINAHVYFYLKTGKKIPAGMQLDHLCKHRACINPEHVEPVSQVTNARRGRQSKLNIELVRELRKEYTTYKCGLHCFARDHGISFGTMSDLIHGYSWKEEEEAVQPTTF